VTASVCFFLGVGIFLLLSAFLFARQVIGAAAFLKRQYKAVVALLGLLLPTFAYAQPEHGGGGEANLVLPDLSTVSFFGINGHALLMIGLLFCVGGLLFGLAIYVQLKNAPVHRSMLEISELIYETCKTYLITQGKFIMLLWIFIAVIISLYFGWLAPVPNKPIMVTLPIILLFSLVGIAGSYGVAWFGIRVNTFANSRTAFAGLRGKPYPIMAIPLKAGMSIGMLNCSSCSSSFCSFRAIMRAHASSASPSAKALAPQPCVSREASSPRSPTSAPTS
jgi:K(+)-stimulated pyrophosphate-energized sodium pump